MEKPDCNRRRVFAIGTWRNLYGQGQSAAREVVDKRGDTVQGLNKKVK